MEQYVFQMNPVSTEYGLLFTQGGLGTLSQRALLTQGEPIHQLGLILLQQTRRRLVSCGQFFDTTLGSDWLVIEPISVPCDLCEDTAIFPLIIDHLFQVTTSADGILRLCRDFFYRSDHDVSLSTYILLCLSTLYLNNYNVCHIRPQVMNC